MVHPVHGTDPDKAEHRTYKTLDPAGEIAVVQRPEGTVKIVFYTGSGAERPVIPRCSWTAKRLRLGHGNPAARLPHRGRTQN